MYPRKANTNRGDFEGSVAALEQAQCGLTFASGSAAIAMVVHIFEPYSKITTIADIHAGECFRVVSPCNDNICYAYFADTLVIIVGCL